MKAKEEIRVGGNYLYHLYYEQDEWGATKNLFIWSDSLGPSMRDMEDCFLTEFGLSRENENALVQAENFAEKVKIYVVSAYSSSQIKI